MLVLDGEAWFLCHEGLFLKAERVVLDGERRVVGAERPLLDFEGCVMMDRRNPKERKPCRFLDPAATFRPSMNS